MMPLNAECIKLFGSQTVTRPTALHDIRHWRQDAADPIFVAASYKQLSMA